MTDRLFELCLSFLQVIKLFPDTESMRGGTRLFFLAGDRVLKYLGRALDNEKSLTKMLRYVRWYSHYEEPVYEDTVSILNCLNTSCPIITCMINA